jgi:hypothetical protein
MMDFRGISGNIGIFIRFWAFLLRITQIMKMEGNWKWTDISFGGRGEAGEGKAEGRGDNGLKGAQIEFGDEKMDWRLLDSLVWI